MSVRPAGPVEPAIVWPEGYSATPLPLTATTAHVDALTGHLVEVQIALVS